MTKLSDTQCVILSAAAQRDGNIALPLPTSLRGGAAKKVVGALLAKGYLAEVPAGRAPGTPVWDETDDGHFTTLVATADGLTAIGIEPEGSDAQEADAAPDTATESASDAPDAGATTEDATPDEGAPPGDTVADSVEAKTPKTRAGTKQAQLIVMLRAPGGASIEEIAAALGWRSHTVRGAIAGAVKKKLGLEVTSEKVEARGRVYKLPPA